MFLAERTSHGGPERVCDLLNGSREFLPAIGRDEAEERLSSWRRAVERTRNWAQA